MEPFPEHLFVHLGDDGGLPFLEPDPDILPGIEIPQIPVVSSQQQAQF